MKIQHARNYRIEKERRATFRRDNLHSPMAFYFQDLIRGALIGDG